MSEPTSAASRAVSRREFFASTGTGLAMSAAVASGLTGCAPATMTGGGAPATGGPGQRLLLKGGVVRAMSADPEKALLADG
jgi:hypothetical protein